MDKNRCRRDRPPDARLNPNSGEGIRFSLRGEETLLQSISSGAPLPEILNGICSALDGQLGNVVSLVCLREDDAAVLSAISGNPRQFGLYAFCSAGVFTENDELLGCLEIYCCVPRSPSASEFQLITRATCLAAIAINRFNETGDDGNFGMEGHRPVKAFLPEWPESMN